MSASASSPPRSPPPGERGGRPGSHSRSAANWRYFLLGGSVPPFRRGTLSDSPEENRRLADAYTGRSRSCTAAFLPLAGAGEDNAEKATKVSCSTWSRGGWPWLKSEQKSIMSNGHRASACSDRQRCTRSLEISSPRASPAAHQSGLSQAPEPPVLKMAGCSQRPKQ